MQIKLREWEPEGKFSTGIPWGQLIALPIIRLSIVEGQTSYRVWE